MGVKRDKKNGQKQKERDKGDMKGEEGKINTCKKIAKKDFAGEGK